MPYINRKKHRWFPKFVSGLWLVPYDFGESPFFSLRALMGSRTLNDGTTMRVTPKDLGVVETVFSLVFPFSNSQKCSMIHIFFHFLTRYLHFRFCFPKESAWNPNVFTSGTMRWVKWEASTKTCSFLCCKIHVLKKRGFTKEFNHPYCFRICGCGKPDGRQCPLTYCHGWWGSAGGFEAKKSRRPERCESCVFETIEVCWKAGRI